MTLKWRDILGYENTYQISDNGEVRNIKTKRILKKYLNKYGYYQVTLCKNNKARLFRVHRLVAMTFIPNKENKEQVNHIDGNKLNNKVDNLEWCSSSENIKHAFKNGLKYSLRGKNNILSKRTYQYDKEYNLLKVWDSIADITRELNIKKQYISACCLGKIKKTHGYIFKYE